MIEKTTFSNIEIKEEILIQYGININKIKFINKGSANIYKIFSNDNEIYVLKEFQSKYTKDDVLREINAIAYLRENSKIPLPKYIQCKNGKFYFLHKQKVVVMQEFIEGHVFNKNEGNYEQLLESARYLGEIINGFEKYETNQKIDIKDWYSKEEIEKANKKYNAILKKADNSKIGNKIKKDMAFKKQLLKDLEKIIDFSEINLITHKVSHGDYSSLQFIYDDNNKVKAILDFIKVKKLPIIWEIARSYSYIDEKAKNGHIDIKNIVAYTKEVSKVTKLNKYDLKYLSYVYLIQLARSTYGYEEYFNGVTNKEELLEFAFYRTNICRELYSKANLISNELLNIEEEG